MKAIDTTATTLELAVHLGREDLGLYRIADLIVSDAQAIVSAGRDAKRARSKRARDDAYARAQQVAERYGARVVRVGEEAGVTMGLRFWSARYGKGVFSVS